MGEHATVRKVDYGGHRRSDIVTITITANTAVQTKQLQDALKDCGWESAADLQQQDTSEAFTFITGQLELPLLTLKMDLFHTGKEEPNDDHKFVNERLLEVAILSEPVEGSTVITLEDCLENYFNNRIEVKRHIERQRRSTLQSVSPMQRPSSFRGDSEKGADMHIETLEFARSESPVTEIPPSPTTPATPSKNPLEKLRSPGGRKRTDSIFSQRRVEGIDPEKQGPAEVNLAEAQKQRKLSTRTEVLMPAWQFFKLLRMYTLHITMWCIADTSPAWYTDNIPTSDAQVAQHFSKKRPILGICLKRYSMSHSGVASRLNTYVDIPLEIAVPNFVSDDNIDDDEGPLVGNFKLVLQSVVCHRGTSVTSGHYVALVRGHAANATGSFSSDRPSFASGTTDSATSDYQEDPWMRFDDLAKERVTYIDIVQALKEESPYLLFYQVQPIHGDNLFGDPPSYTEATSRSHSDAYGMDEKPMIPEALTEDRDIVLVESNSPTSPNGGTTTDSQDWAPSGRTSLDTSTVLEGPRGRSSMSSNRRSSIAVDELSSVDGGSVKMVSVPSTPVDETRSSFLQLPSRRASRAGVKKSKSRPGSQGAEGSMRFSLNMSKLTSRMSRSDLPASEKEKKEDAGNVSDGSAQGDKTVDKEGMRRVRREKEKADKEKEKAERDREKAEKEKEKKERHHLHRRKEVPERDCVIM